MSTQDKEREYQSVHGKRRHLHNSIRKNQIQTFFESRRKSILGESREDLLIKQIKEQIKSNRHYFKNINNTLNHLKTIIDILHEDIGERTTISALTCLSDILKGNHKVICQRMLSIDPQILEFLAQKLISGAGRVKLKVLNIFNWLAGEYKEETLERLWKTRLIDILYNILKGPTSSTLTEISINLVANMLSDETCKNIMDHPMLNKIISFLKHQNYNIQIQAYSCVQTVLYHLEPAEVNSLIRKFKIMPVVCYQLQNGQYSSREISISGLRIIKKYIQTNINKDNDYNSAVNELQMAYDFGSTIEQISRYPRAESGPLLEISELADELIDIIAQCVNNDAL